MLRTYTALIGLFLLIPLFTSALTPASPVFARTLKIGDSGRDVFDLQVLLNQDADTRIAYTGPGSPGAESSYFGKLTAAAVIRFQEKHRTQVLYPAGLVRGTGVVGVLTRAKLNALSTLKGTESSSAPPVEVAAAQPPFLTNVSPETVKAGEEVVIFGKNFAATGNEVLLGGRRIDTSSSKDGASIVVAIPSGTAPAAYQIAVRTPRGTSEQLPVLVLAASQAEPAGPSISKISPTHGGNGTVVTITGSGFRATGNTVYAGYAEFTDVPSPDGKMLQVTINPGWRKGPISSFTVPLWIYIKNSGGYSKTTIFTFEAP
jgi:hypothetical protein